MCAILTHTEIIPLTTQTKTISMSMRRCIMLYTGYICNEGIFKALLSTANLPQIPKCTLIEMKNRNKRPHSILSELQYKYRFMHTMKASFPIFWLVSQHCYDALLCIWAIFFFHSQKRKKEKMSCVLRANNCCLIRTPCSS